MVAAVLHLQKEACAVAPGARFCERANVLGLHGKKAMQAVAAVLADSLFLHPCVVKKLYEVGLLVRSQHKVNPFNGAHLCGLKLGVTTCDDHERTGVFAHHLVYGLTAFVVCHIGHGAGVYKTYIGFLVFICRADAKLLEHLTKG